MMSIRLTQALIPPHPTNRVFHLDPSLRERPIEGYVLWWAVFASRFAPRAGCLSCRMCLANPYIPQITNRTHSLWQEREQLRVAQYRHIGSRSLFTLCYITNQTILFIDRHLRLEGMLLLFAAVVPISLGTHSRTLDALLEGIDNDGQFGRLLEQGVEGLAALASWVGHTKGVQATRFEQRKDASNDARDGTVADTKEVGENLISRIEAQPDGGEQQLVSASEVVVATAAWGAAAVGTEQASAVGLSDAREHIGEQLVELFEVQAGHLEKDGRIAVQVIVATDHHTPRQLGWWGRWPIVYPIFPVL
jgi:hypothetical protein